MNVMSPLLLFRFFFFLIRTCPLSPSFKDERLPFSPPPQPSYPNKKRVANFSRRSTQAQHRCCLQPGTAARPTNYHFKLFSQQVFFFPPTLFSEVATPSK
jgi:hypothetical protein